MKYFNLIALFSGVIAVTCLQGPSMDSIWTIDKLGIVGGQEAVEEEQVPVPVCDLAGYSPVNCSLIVPNCTGGTFQVPTSGTGLPDLFQRAATKTVRGNCTGPANCVTPATSDLTSVGC